MLFSAQQADWLYIHSLCGQRLHGFWVDRAASADFSGIFISGGAM